MIDFVPPALSFNETINGTLRTVSFLDAEWVSYHGCTDICRSFHVSTLFRSQGEYQTLTQKELRTNLFDDFGLYITPKESLLTRYMTAILGGSKFVISFIIIQGIMAATFGRRNPRQVRDVMYVFLRDIKLPSLIISRIAYHGTHNTEGTEKCKKWLAKFFSSCTYGCALLATILCLPVLLLIITALEFKLYGLPQSESAIHVGAWTFWAGTGLVLSASFVLKFHDRAVMGLSNILRHYIRNVFQHIKTQQTMETDRRPGFPYKASKGYGKLTIRKFGLRVLLSTSKILENIGDWFRLLGGVVTNEVKNFGEFWQNTDGIAVWVDYSGTPLSSHDACGVCKDAGLGNTSVVLACSGPGLEIFNVDQTQRSSRVDHSEGVSLIPANSICVGLLLCSPLNRRGSASF